MAAQGFFDMGTREGEPSKGKGPAITQDVGPLPVWGWAAVGVAAIFLWRRIAGPKAAAATPGTTGWNQADYPGGGPVFVLPQSPFSTAPAAAPVASPGGGYAGPTWLGDPGDVQNAYQAEQQAIGQLASQLIAQGKADSTNARVIAAKQLGYPYTISTQGGPGAAADPNGGYLYDPVTNMSIPVANWREQWNRSPIYGEALSLGRSAAWTAWAEGQNYTTPGFSLPY